MMECRLQCNFSNRVSVKHTSFELSRYHLRLVEVEHTVESYLTLWACSHPFKLYLRHLISRVMHLTAIQPPFPLLYSVNLSEESHFLSSSLFSVTENQSLNSVILLFQRLVFSCSSLPTQAVKTQGINKINRQSRILPPIRRKA